MKDFIAVHHDGKNTTLTYTDTEKDARAYLAALITTNQVAREDTLSIIRVYDDSVIYFKRRNSTLKSVLAEKKQKAAIPSRSTGGFFQEILTKLSRKLTSLGIAFSSR
ncbi:hypothetical protein GCM10027347_12780 [Larkinella harenae]